MIFEDDELAELQTEIKEVMDEVASDLFNSFRGSTRTRDENTPDQFVVTPTQILSNYPCNYRTTNNQERFLAGLDSSVNLITVTVPGGIDLLESDDLTILAKGSAAAIPMTVKVILRTSNSLRWKTICVTK